MSSFRPPTEKSANFNPRFYETSGSGDVSQEELDAKLNRVGGTLVSGALVSPTISDPIFQGTATGLTFSKASVGLANVDNTSDANKPISTATATALASKLGNTNTILGYANFGTAAYPWYAHPAIFGGIAANMTGGHGELDFVNSGSIASSPPSTSAFDWYQMTSASTKTLLMRLFLGGALSVPGSIVSPTISTINANVAALQTGKADTGALDSKLDKSQGVHGPWTYFSANAATDNQHYDDATIVGGLTGCLVPGSSDLSFVQTGNNTSSSGTAFSFHKATSANMYTKLAHITNTGDFIAQGVVTGTNIASMVAGIASKAAQTALDATNASVSGLTSGLATTNSAVALKANQTALDATNTTVASKAAQTALDATNTTVSGLTSGLATTNSAVALKATQTALDATNTTVASKAAQTALDATNAVVATKITNQNAILGITNFGTQTYPWYAHSSVFGAISGNATGGSGELAFWNSGSVTGPTVTAFDWNLATSSTTKTNLMRLLQNGNLSVPGSIIGTNITSLTSSVATNTTNIALKANQTALDATNATVATLSSAAATTVVSVSSDTTLTLAQVSNTIVTVLVSNNDVSITLPDLASPFVGSFRLIFDKGLATNTGTVTLHHPTSAKIRSPGWLGALQDVTLSERDNIEIPMYNASYWMTKAPTGYRQYKALTVGADTSLVATDICETMAIMLTANTRTITFPNPSVMPIGTRFNIKFLEDSVVTPTYTVTLAIDQSPNAWWRLNNAIPANFKTTLSVSSGQYLECVKWSATNYLVLSTV